MEQDFRTSSIPLDGVTISGPATGIANTAYTFTATVSPPTATTPISYTWSPAPGSGQGTSSAGYTWATGGVKTITVTAANAGGAVSDTHAITITGLTVRAITYEYDPLGRLVEAGYSSGERFEYTYDAAGNRTAMTSTTPLSGTLVTTYTYDAANRLTDRAVSDGRTYTYTWSARGQLLAEWTQGYPVRTFPYNAAGQMISATVFTLTTHFTYNGDGARVAVSVEGHGTTTYTLDYAAGNRILAETSSEGTKLYLYGHECLGELADEGLALGGVEGWLYYLHDGEGLVRQGVDEQGQVVSTWLYDPDGTVLEGPDGPVSHLVCGGVYDWSTGLIHKDGNYFDPVLGIWLALAPLFVVQSWRGRKKKRRGWPWYVMVVLVVVGVGGTLVACGPSPTPVLAPTLIPCIDVEEGIDPIARGYLAFVDKTFIEDGVIPWPPHKKEEVKTAYNEAAKNFAITMRGWDRWSRKLGISKAPDPSTGFAGGAIRLMYGYHKPNRAAAIWYPKPEYGGRFPTIWFGVNNDSTVREAYHELAHIWDGAHHDALGRDMQREMGVSGQTTDEENHGDFPTDGAKEDSREDFAESVTSYFAANALIPYARYTEWSDDDPNYQKLNNVPADSVWYPPHRMDRYDYLQELFDGSL